MKEQLLRFEGFPPTSFNHGQRAYVQGHGAFAEGAEVWVLEDTARFLLATHVWTDVTPKPEPVKAKKTADKADETAAADAVQE